jgi:hypothetical protein
MSGNKGGARLDDFGGLAGMISLTDLPAARVRNPGEERDGEKVLRVRVA